MRITQTTKYLCPVLLMFRTRGHLQLYSSSSLVIRLAARVKWSCAATLFTNTFCAYNTRLAASVATMSTVAIPQQPLSQPLQHHAQIPSSYNPHDATTFDSDLPISPSSTSSKSSRRSRKSSQDRKIEEVQSGQSSRMSAFFPLGYKEAASQWVRVEFLQYPPISSFCSK